MLPSNKRRTIQTNNKKTIWLYGVPFSGKTTFANTFPDPLMINTDGNIKYVDAPFIAIKDEVTPNGRLEANRVYAWEQFKNTVAELELKQNEFKTIVVDLIEDLREHCRLYMYKKLSTTKTAIAHESDVGYGKGYDLIQNEFLTHIRRLLNCDYENIILISHEDKTKDFTDRKGQTLTSIKPNIQDKLANKIAGMVDIVARIVVENDEHVLSFKTDSVIFGGGRLKIERQEIPLDYNEFLKVYDERMSSGINVSPLAPIDNGDDDENDKKAYEEEMNRALTDEELKIVDEQYANPIFPDMTSSGYCLVDESAVQNINGNMVVVNGTAEVRPIEHGAVNVTGGGHIVAVNETTNEALVSVPTEMPRRRRRRTE